MAGITQAQERFRDIATTKLGYFTDNGAMLYGDAWGHDLDCCNETVLRAVKRGLDAQHVPIHWVQLDDWWYKGFMPEGGGVYCTEEWVPWPAAFPSGLDTLQQDMGASASPPAHSSSPLFPLSRALSSFQPLIAACYGTI